MINRANETVDFAGLTDKTARETFYSCAIDPWISSTEGGFSDILGYIGFIAKGMDEAKVTEADQIQRSSADAVFGGLHKVYLEIIGTEGSGHYEHQRLNEWDKVIRSVHGFTGTEVLTAHEDPLIASFYTTFGRHLDIPTIGERTSPWG